MPFVGFLAAAMAATAVRLVLIRTLASLIEGTLLDILDWIGNNQLWLTIASFVGVFVYVMWTNRSSTEPIESVETIAEELDEAAAEVADGDPRALRAQLLLRCMPARSPRLTSLTATLRLASSIISSPSITAPLRSPSVVAFS